MPLKNYAVLKGSVVGRSLATSNNAHYQIHVVDETTDYRIAVNVKSKLSPSDLQYVVVSRFEHPITAKLADLAVGVHPVERKPDGVALDYIRGNLFDPRDMRVLPMSVDGPDNDLNEKLDSLVQRTMGSEDALIYAFGETWGPESKKDKIFGFLPGNGIHDIHMNQGNHSSFAHTDGVWQDGGLIFHFPAQNEWAAVFLKFQSQSWHTDDNTGKATHPPVSGPPSDDGPSDVFEPGALPTTADPDGLIRIVGALVNGKVSPEEEWVTLLNVSDRDISLDGWKLANKQKQRQPLTGSIGAGAALRVKMSPQVPLSNQGGIITLLNPDGLKVDGVSYTKREAQNPGWTLKF